MHEASVCLQEAKNGDFDLKMDYLEQKIDLELGTLKLTEAYQEIIDYNYRPGAVKAVISIASTPCEKSPFLLSVSIYLFSLNIKVKIKIKTTKSRSS